MRIPIRSDELAGVSSSGNLLLRHLNAADREAIMPHLRPVVLARGQTLLRASEAIATLYFPEAGAIALEEGAGASRIEIAVVGREGVLGWPALLGRGCGLHDAIVQAEGGRAHAIDRDALLAACRTRMGLWTALLGFVQSVMDQMSRTIATQIESSLEQRIARWLLMRHDRLGGDQLIVRHDQIARALNARRASITDRLQLLEGRRSIRCRRGRVIVADRAALEHLAGDAYDAERRYPEMMRATAT